MKVKIIALNYGNKHTGIIVSNLAKCGYESRSVILDIAPLPKALNTGLSYFTKGYDGIVLMGNDIVEPRDWLKKRVDYLTENPSCGIVSINCNKIPNNSPDLIGNFLIKKEVFEKIGYFTTEFGDYGPLDLDYCTRARKAGFKTEYVPDEYAEHKQMGADKTAMVEKVWPLHVQNVVNYENGTKEIFIADNKGGTKECQN